MPSIHSLPWCCRQCYAHSSQRGLGLVWGTCLLLCWLCRFPTCSPYQGSQRFLSWRQSHRLLLGLPDSSRQGIWSDVEPINVKCHDHTWTNLEIHSILHFTVYPSFSKTKICHLVLTSSSAVSEWPSLPYPPKPQLNACRWLKIKFLKSYYCILKSCLFTLLFSSTATVWLGPQEIFLMIGIGRWVTW